MSYTDLPKVSLASLALVLLMSPLSTLQAADSGKDAAVPTAITAPAVASEENPQSQLLDAGAEIKKISKQVQSLKSEVIDLNTDLRMMEEQLLFPSSTKFSIMVSLSSGEFFQLESVKLKLDGKLVATHIYSENERQAMLRGGIHRVYVTNLVEGKHTATAFFTGIGPGGREYKRAENVEFEKTSVSKYLELTIGDDGVKQEPLFAIKQW